MRDCWRSASARFLEAGLLAGVLLWLGLGAGACRREAGRPSGDERPAQVISVCELLKNLASYRGKIVAVRGIEYYGLRARSCPEEFVTGNRRWPWAVDLVHSSHPSPGEERVQFATDDSSWDEWGEVLIREAKAGLRGEIWMTVLGKVRARQTYIREDGAVFLGYGHLGVLPAQLVVKRIFDIEVKRDPPTYDYSIILKYPAL